MNHSTRVKVCGMRSAEDIDLAVISGADAVGFITDVPVETPRKIDLKKARELIPCVPFFVDSVLVIMPESATEAIDMINSVRPDVVQIHSPLDIDNMRSVRDNTDVRIIRTFHVPSEGDVMVSGLVDEVNLLSSEDLIDGILLDSYVSGKVGGTGKVHDLSISRQVVELVDVPVVLAGGLNADNVAECVKQVSPFAVDTASGVETDGKKDAEKIRRFVNEVRCAR
ncbi:phosphoribosylanthranilate isomerase [Methanococcoides methylutens]|uniref:N-(5'-phosphoribosyl)anthranilate isomerase n=1 Tax=Methanococcoides methylutens MM1 TaxID=1434104 RepID=A0A0E3SR17_METMT|nr:phosphoribosylanthranilate isomerase [Methanococcoides methylutens]AKB84562.1 Phosphoribosylanthranilate isomerase [Methanococcoides methylutens MM1]